MALKPCKHCREQMSSIAYNCPHCSRVTNLGGLHRGLGNEFIFVILALMLMKIW
jgi:hypothetical protein